MHEYLYPWYSVFMQVHSLNFAHLCIETSGRYFFASSFGTWGGGKRKTGRILDSQDHNIKPKYWTGKNFPRSELTLFPRGRYFVVPPSKYCVCIVCRLAREVVRGKGRREDRVAVTAGVGSEGAGYAPPHVMRRSREPRFGRTRPRMRKLKLAVVRRRMTCVI